MKPTKKRPSKINRKFWDMMFGKMKKLGTAIEMFKGPEMSIDDAEHYWVNDRIEEGLTSFYDSTLICNHHYTDNGATWKGIG